MNHLQVRLLPKGETKVHRDKAQVAIGLRSDHIGKAQ